MSAIYQNAAARKGGDEALEALLPKPKTAAQLNRITDNRYLAEMTKCVFRSGFVWQVIENKWPGFEAAFDGFDTTACAMLSDEALEQLGEDTRIVRNGAKIASVRDNAQFVREVKQEHGGFGRYVGAWPVDVVTALMRQKVIDKTPTSKKALADVQAAFNKWHADSGRSLAEISRTLACTVG